MQDQVVLITGGARRVGAAICRMLHAEGARLMVHYRHSHEAARALEAELNARRPDSVALIQGDLHDMGFLQSLPEQAVARFGRLDVLVNNASSYFPTEVGRIVSEDWNELIGTNLKAPLFLSQAAAPALKVSRGCIVNITDMHVERPKKGYVVYSVAKAGLANLTRSLAQELAPEIRVNAVAPGPVLWPEDNPEFDDAYRQKVIQQTLLKRIGSPEDVAKAVRFMVKDAPYITGQMIAVDGGRFLSL